MVLVIGIEAYHFRDRFTLTTQSPFIGRLANTAYYNSRSSTWDNTYWLGVPIEKYPTDLIVFEGIIFETKPDVTIEAGTRKGGSAYYFASLFDLLGTGRVNTMDIKNYPEKPKHPRIEYLLMSSVSDEAVNRIGSEIRPGERNASLDSNHAADQELQIYSSMVTKGCYLVVDDTNINGHPVNPYFGPGPMEAVEKFMDGNHDFEVDRSREKFMLTVSLRGYLGRVL